MESFLTRLHLPTPPESSLKAKGFWDMTSPPHPPNPGHLAFEDMAQMSGWVKELPGNSSEPNPQEPRL